MIYQFESFTFESAKGIIHKDNKEIKLTKTQRRLLNYFLDNPKIILSKTTLMDEVWGRIVTENSVDQVISILRGHLEDDPLNPLMIVTHYGQGISFEAKAILQNNDANPPTDVLPSQTSNRLTTKIILIASLVLVALWVRHSFIKKPLASHPAASKNQKVLVLPTVFVDKTLSTLEQQGMKSLLKSSFNIFDTEEQIIFDETSLTTQQAVEKHWKIEDELVVIRSSVKKNGDAFQAVIELASTDSTKKTTLSANNLDELLNKQINFIATIQQGSAKNKIIDLQNNPIDELFIQASGHHNKGNLSQAKKLIQQLLAKQDNHYQARLLLIDILREQKKYDESFAQLIALKSTDAYQQIATEIELKLAEVRLIKSQHQELINNLKNYQATHLSIPEIKKAKIQILLGKAYLAMGKPQGALKSFKQAIINLDELINPSLYAQSYFGQAQIMSASVNDDKLYTLFNTAYEYAISAADLHQQVMALNKMAQIRMLQNQWQEAVALTKKSLQVMELTDNKEQIAKGLSTLVTILNLRGQLTEAREVNSRLGKIAEELNSDLLRLYFLHFDAILDMNQYKWAHAQEQIDKQLKIAIKIGNHNMQLNNSFIHLELMLLKKDIKDFKTIWDDRVAMINEKGFERFQVYMDLYLGRYYKQLHQDQKAIDILTQVSELVKAQGDMKVFTDAQNQLATVYLRSDPKKSLVILNNLEQYNPHPNPYLEIKAQALNKLGQNIEALSILNQAKLIYHEGWTSENEALLKTLQQSIQ